MHKRLPRHKSTIYEFDMRTVMSMSITWWSLVNSPRVSAMGGRTGVGRPLVGGGRRMVDVAIRDTIRAHFGQYPPEHQHTSITTRLTLSGGHFWRYWWNERDENRGGVIGIERNAKCARLGVCRRQEGRRQECRRQGGRGDGRRLDMFPSIYAPIPPHSMQVAYSDFTSGDFFLVSGFLPLYHSELHKVFETKNLQD